MNSDVREFKDSFANLYERRLSGRSLQKSAISMDSLNGAKADSAILVEAYAGLPAQQEEYAIQRVLRRWFGKKPEVNQSAIGAHPDFKHLYGTDDVELQHITTVFVDIKNSTRLTLRYELPVVRHIKNSILQAASEAVRALDGHVHRFMGDALMAYFGSRQQNKESSAMAAISYAAILRLLMQESVVPSLREKGIDPLDIGFRVGIDFGDDKDVLWSSYGFSDVHEITATSFHVDVSAKLQSMASKDNTMLGHNLVQFLDFPSSLTAQKTEMREGKREVVKFLRPNYISTEGAALDYQVYELDFKKFSCLLPLPPELKTIIAPEVVARSGISFAAYVREGSGARRLYPSMSECLAKNIEIQFELRAEPHSLNGLKLPLTGKFVKQNHGVEAANDDSSQPEIINFSLKPSVGTFKNAQASVYACERNTAYRGVHTMRAELVDGNGHLVFSDVLGIHIK